MDVPLQIAVAQFGPRTDKNDNLASIRRLAADAAAAGARVVVAPEYAMFTAPKLDERLVEAAEPLDGEFVAGLQAIAAAESIHLVAGIAERLDEPRISNTLVVAGPAGALVTTYRKLHLYDAFGFAESDVVRPGDITDPATFTVDGITLGLQTCYDIRFPESARRVVDAGAQALLYPAQWVPGPLKEDHWTTLVRARAIENTVYVAAADQCAPGGAGNSMIVDPMGVVLGSAGERVGFVAAGIDVDRIEQVRKRNPALTLRRFR